MATKTKRASTKPGKKYLLVTADGMFGPTVLYSDSIKGFSSFYLNEVKNRKVALWKAVGDQIFRIKANGRIY